MRRNPRFSSSTLYTFYDVGAGAGSKNGMLVMFVIHGLDECRNVKLLSLLVYTIIP
jgi:hypothetical protein